MAFPIGTKGKWREAGVTRMVRSAWSGLALFALLLALPLSLLVLLRKVPRLDPIFEDVNFHIVVVGIIAACALQVAILAALAASRGRRPAPVLLALGCVLVGTFMLAHGLTTPGVGSRPFNMWVARFPVLAIAGFAAFLAAASSREDGRLLRNVARYPSLWLLAPTISVVALCAAIVASPLILWGSGPFPGEPSARQVLIFGSAAALVATGWIHWRRWRLSRDRVELALVLASWLSVDALASLELAELWRLSWWDYHAYLLIGFAAAAYAVLAASRRTRSIEGALTSISLRDPLEHIRHGYPEALHALVGAVEAKDRYTLGHSARVAELSNRIGMVLGLGPDRLRGLTQGALLHDVGKIGVPDHILNKPGALTPEEREWIEQHPMAGWDMAVRVPSLRDALVVVRHHHERWDGGGYPDRLAGEDIALAARIAAVADVWDALTSDRAYRPAWEEERALTLIMDERGEQFDPHCVDAFLQVLAGRDQTREQTRTNPEHLPA
jgi:HD-GYP domain-containing protein (c-di-GMP phosphodiesterase class II)